MPLKMYMSYVEEPQEGASLVFAHSSREAKKLAWQGCPVCGDGGEFTAVRVKWLPDKDYPWLRREADPKKLAADQGHVIDSPRSCRHCETWGKAMANDEECEDCVYDRALDLAQADARGAADAVVGKRLG